MIVYLKEKIVMCLDSFYKAKKADMFEGVDIIAIEHLTSSD